MDYHRGKKLIDCKWMTMKQWVKNYDPYLPKEYPEEYAKWTTTSIGSKGSKKTRTGAYADNLMEIRVFDMGGGYVSYVNQFDYADSFMDGTITRDIRGKIPQ